MYDMMSEVISDAKKCELIKKMAKSYLSIRFPSQIDIAIRYGVSKKTVYRYFKYALPKISPELSAKVDLRAKKNLARGRKNRLRKINKLRK